MNNPLYKVGQKVKFDRGVGRIIKVDWKEKGEVLDAGFVYAISFGGMTFHRMEKWIKPV